MKYQVTEIVYDIDEPQEENEGSVDEIRDGLPTTLIVEVDDEDQIADAVSDITGWCVLNFTSQKVR